MILDELFRFLPCFFFLFVWFLFYCLSRSEPEIRKDSRELLCLLGHHKEFRERMVPDGDGTDSNEGNSDYTSVVDVVVNTGDSKVKMPVSSSSDEFKLARPTEPPRSGDCMRLSLGNDPFVLILINNQIHNHNHYRSHQLQVMDSVMNWGSWMEILKHLAGFLRTRKEVGAIQNPSSGSLHLLGWILRFLSILGYNSNRWKRAGFDFIETVRM